MTRPSGFTVIELIIAIAMIGVLAAIAVSVYQTHTIRSEIVEGIEVAAPAKSAVNVAFLQNGNPPTDRSAAGLTANPADTSSSLVTSVDVRHGALEITYGNQASTAILGRKLFLIPYEDPDLGIAWVCGNASLPPGAVALSTGSDAARTAITEQTTVPARYLPQGCR